MSPFWLLNKFWSRECEKRFLGQKNQILFHHRVTSKKLYLTLQSQFRWTKDSWFLKKTYYTRSNTKEYGLAKLTSSMQEAINKSQRGAKNDPFIVKSGGRDANNGKQYHKWPRGIWNCKDRH